MRTTEPSVQPPEKRNTNTKNDNTGLQPGNSVMTKKEMIEQADRLTGSASLVSELMHDKVDVTRASCERAVQNNNQNIMVQGWTQYSDQLPAGLL